LAAGRPWHTTRSSTRWSREHAPASLTSRPGAEKGTLAKASCSQIDLGDTSAYAWSPSLLDYLFLAFNTSTAFSLTDNAILSRRAKVLMMQELHLLLIFAVLVSQAINALAAV
jgi:hypothetical protein